MLLHFHLHYKTIYGESIGIKYNLNTDHNPEFLLFQTYDGENWIGSLEIESAESFTYKYQLNKHGKDSVNEWGKHRILDELSHSDVFIQDQWRSRENEKNIFLSTAFTKSIFKRNIPKREIKFPKGQKSNQIQFKLQSAQIASHLKFGVIGNIPALGSWKEPICLDDHLFPLWEGHIDFESANVDLEYKYVIYDPVKKIIIDWEIGENRKIRYLFPSKTGNLLIVSDDSYKYADTQWRGSGVAIPVFSLRSKIGLGIGEFNDLIQMVEWTNNIGMDVIQVLPINDTIANKTWLDSYPYAAISVFALNPLYINLDSVAKLENKIDQEKLDKERTRLNALETVDFEAVLDLKFELLRKLFDQEYQSFLKDKDAIDFIKNNASWLKSYAAFCHLRDKNKTCNFGNWKEHSTFSSTTLDTLCNQSYKQFKKIEFYYFLQYHADKQLLAVKNYARDKGVVLKGDLPIGIYRYSCDAWVAPELYNIDEQAGAPPDDYAVLGQNWGFPTYNWEVMAQNDFVWWKNRMQVLNRYFDALRIDHILGFFRIWQIPTDSIEGTMGMFNPRRPYSIQELRDFNVNGDLSRYTQPFITKDLLDSIFGKDLEKLKELFFIQDDKGKIKFKESLDTQQKIHEYISKHDDLAPFEKSLFGLVSNVLLLEEPNSKMQYFNPRITLSTTSSFQYLDQVSKGQLTALYNDYYFKRHDEFWKEQALWKLPAILDASDMLICGEDLGMIPNSVPGVMKELNIISLEIQRMPKGNQKFGQVSQYPYFSVCSPSCHDMSTIRGWWEADHENAKEFYYNYLGFQGLTPLKCNPEIVQAIIEDHLASPSLFAIFPLQDLIAMDESLAKKDAFSEQINEPSNPKHYWRYRFHFPIEDLIKSSVINQKIKSLVNKYR